MKILPKIRRGIPGLRFAFLGMVAIAAPAVHGGTLVINPGGGVEPDGSDGLRIVVNEACNPSTRSGFSSGDQIFFAGKSQFYQEGVAASEVGPMLRIGSVLTSQASFFRNNSCYDSIVVSELTGTAEELVADRDESARSTNKGAGGAVVTYTKGGYVIRRTISYTYPQQYYEDSYEVSVPDVAAGTPVEFFYGGDYFPGGDDLGYGTATSAPLQGIYVNVPSSNIKVGIRQVTGEAGFDYYFAGCLGFCFNGRPEIDDLLVPGLNLSNTIEASTVDVALAIQWRIGPTTGSSYTVQRKMQHVVDYVAQPTTISLTVPPSSTASGQPYAVSGAVTLQRPIPGLDSLPGSVTVREGESGPSCTASTLGGSAATGIYQYSCNITPTTLGERTLTAKFLDTANEPDQYKTSSATGTHTVRASTTCQGFFAPVDQRPTTNQAKAGRAIPLRWSCTKDGAPVTERPSDFRVTAVSCPQSVSSVTGADPIEEYAGNSDLLSHLGGGVWQFNWTTPVQYARQCRTGTVTFEGATISADFQFVR